MKYISLTQEKCAVIDDEDYPEISKYKWHLGRDEARTTSIKGKNISMQSLIANPQNGEIVIHKNANRLDNRRANLIIGNKGTVNLTRGIQSNNDTGYRGVYRYRNGRFGAKIGVNKRVTFLGYYDTPEQAAAAYNAAAFNAWGDLAPLNDLGDLVKPPIDLIGRKKAYDTKVLINSRTRMQEKVYKKIYKKADKRASQMELESLKDRQ